MNRILKLHVNDLLVNASDANQMVNDACRHHRPMKVVGGALYEDQLLVMLEEVESQLDWDYVFAQIPFQSVDDVIAEIGSRYFAGFTMFGGFMIKDRYWGLFAYDPATLRSPEPLPIDEN